MKRKLGIFLLACISVLMGSCDKFSNGDVVEKEYVLTVPFQVVEACDNVNLTLKHCDADHQAGFIHIETGENLIDRITTTIEDFVDEGDDSTKYNKLVIRNENTMDFLRPYDYTLEMTVYYDTIYSLIFNSNATVVTDTLRGYNILTHFNDHYGNEFDSLAPCLNLEVYDGSGDFTVLLNCCKLKTRYLNGTSTITIKGIAASSIITGGYNCHGIIDGKDMEANWSAVSYAGTNTVYVKTFDELHLYNYNIGRIFYVKYDKSMTVIIRPHFVDGHWMPGDTIEDSIFHCPRHLEKLGENILPYPN